MTEHNQTKYFFFYTRTNELKLVSKHIFSKTQYPIINIKDNKIRVVGLGDKNKIKTLIRDVNYDSFTAQGIFSDVQMMKEGLCVLMSALKKLGECSSAMRTMDQFLFLDLTKMVLQVIDMISSGISILGVANFVVELYLLYKRNIYQAQMLETFCLASMSMFLPTKLFEIIRRMTILSSAKVVDDMGGFHNLVTLLFESLVYFIDILPFSETIKNIFAPLISILNIGKHHVTMSEIKTILSEVESNSKCIMNDVFRQRVNALAAKIVDSDIVEWCRRSAAVKNYITDFNKLNKRCKSYENTSRVEPVCFVFEGPPGCGKSVTMNKVLDALEMSKYSHLVKSNLDGKDWYDTYNNEEVFYMDDVGQQSISQFRTIINMVSEVKLPLDCADAKLKDTKFFNSEVILFTTNNFQHLHDLSRNDCISDIKALWRRGFVFDFNCVKRSYLNEYSGQVLFKYFDVFSSKFIHGFPPNVLEYFKKNNIKYNYIDESGVKHSEEVPITFNFKESTYLNFVVWITTIIKLMNKMYKERAISNVLSSEERDYIKSMVGFQAQGAIFLKDTVCEIFLSCIKDLVAHVDFMKLAVGGIIVVSLCALINWYRKSDGFMAQSNAWSKFSKAPHTSIDSVSKNIMMVDLYEGEVTTSSLALFSGHVMVVPAHVGVLPEMRLIVYRDLDKTHRIIEHVKINQLYRNQQEDLAIYALPHNMAITFKNISQHIKEGQNTGNLFLCNYKGSVPLSDIPCEFAESRVYNTFVPGFGEFRNAFSKDNAEFYNLQEKGLCGSILIDAFGGIRGMHVAGSNIRNVGISLVWSKQTLTLLHNFLNDSKYILPYDLSPKVLSGFSVAKIENDCHTVVPRHSNFGPTQLYDIYPIRREPANLQKYGKCTVKDIAKKSFKQTLNIDKRELEFGQKVTDFYLKNAQFHILTDKEIIAGNDLLAGINKHSSNGYSCLRDKSEYIDFENNKFTDMFVTELKQLEESILRGDPQWDKFIWTETLKDELRSVEKEGTPRSFRVGTLHHLVLMKKYFGWFVEHIIETRQQTQIMVGINPIEEWPSMYEQLKKAKIVFAGDISNWDGNMLSQVQDAVSQSIISCVSRSGNLEAITITSFLLESITRSLVAVLDDCFITTHSMPSGCYLTAILNSFVNKFYTAMWFFRFSKKKTISHFLDSVVDFVYGDDKLNGINSECDVLNAVTMREFFESVGMGFTDSKKKPITSISQSLDEVTFLKRSFRYHNLLGKVVCPLDLETLYSGLSFCDWTKEYDTVLKDKINCFQREIYLHPERDFLKSDFDERMKKRNCGYQQLSDEYLYNLYTNDFDVSYLSGFCNFLV